MRICSLLIFCVSFLGIAAQKYPMVEGSVRDQTDGTALQGVRVWVKDQNTMAYTNEQGRYSLVLKSRAEVVEINFRLAGYDEGVLQNVRVIPGRTQFADIELKRAYSDLRELEITVADSVWGSPVLHVADYAFFRGGLLLLTYEKEDLWKRQEDADRTLYTGCQLIQLDSTGHELSRVQVHEEMESFYLGFPGEIFLQGRYNVYRVEENKVRITTVALVDKQDFESSIRPVIDTVGDYTIFTTYNPDFPAFEYISYNRRDSTYHTYRYLTDEFTMELFRSEFKYLHPRDKLTAFRYELKTGIDKEIVAAYMNGFQDSPYYEPLNVPLILMNDTLVIFDHHHSRQFRYTASGVPVDSTGINYHMPPKPEKWSGRLICDKVSGSVYTFNTRQGSTFLRKIDTSSGEANSVMKLHHDYVDRIEVHNGWIYYIYRPFESATKRYLWRERL